LNVSRKSLYLYISLRSLYVSYIFKLLYICFYVSFSLFNKTCPLSLSLSHSMYSVTFIFNNLFTLCLSHSMYLCFSFYCLILCVPLFLFATLYFYNMLWLFLTMWLCLSVPQSPYVIITVIKCFCINLVHFNFVETWQNKRLFSFFLFLSFPAFLLKLKTYPLFVGASIEDLSNTESRDKRKCLVLKCLKQNYLN